MTEKPFYQSLTFWFNILFILVGLAKALGFAQFEPSPQAQELGLIFVAAANFLLRFRTKSVLK